MIDSKRIICSNLLLQPNEMFLLLIKWNLELQALGRKGALVGTWSQSCAHRGLKRTYCTLSTPPHWSLYMCPLISWPVVACHPHTQVPDLGTPHKEFKALPSRSLFHEEAQNMVKVKGITRACPLRIYLLEPYQSWLVESHNWGFLISFSIRIVTGNKNKILRAFSLENQYRAHTPLFNLTIC